MTKYKININIEFEAKDFLQAEKVQGKIEEHIFPSLLNEASIRSWEIILQKNEKERLWIQQQSRRKKCTYKSI